MSDTIMKADGLAVEDNLRAELAAERAAREQAEARLAEAMAVIKEVQGMFESETWQCPRCGHAEPTRDCNGHYVTREFLASTTPPLILAELAALKAELEKVNGFREDLRHRFHLQSDELNEYKAVVVALKLKLEAARGALQAIVDHCIHPDVAVRAVMVDLKPIREALSQLNGTDDGESQPPSTAKGTLKAFEQIVNATPFPEGKEMIQTGKAHD